MGGFSLPVEDYTGGSDTYVDPAEELLRRQQEASLQEHKAYAENLQKAQQGIEVRGEDLDISKRLLQATSPQIPKPVREFLLKGISSQVGVDPKGDYSNSLIKMMSGLDPQSLEHMRMTFGADIPNAEPGKIKAQVRAVFQGQIPVSDLITKASQTAPRPDPSLTGQEGTGQLTGAGDQPPARSQADILQPTEEEKRQGNVRRLPTIGETAPRDLPTEPALLNELGLDPTQKARNDDVIKMFPGIPTDPAKQRELVTKLQEQNSNSLTAVNSAIQLHDLFRGKPETLGIVGSTIRTVDEVVDQLNGAARSLGATADKFDLNVPGMKNLLKNTTETISKLYKDSGFEQTAVDSARIQSMTLQMAYDMAISRGIPGNRLTNSIIAQQLTTLGKSASVAQFEGVLKDVAQRSLDEGANRMAATLGSRNYYPNLRNASDDDLQNMVRYSVESGDKAVIPDRYKAQVIQEMDFRAKELEARQAGQTAPQRPQSQLPLASPTIAEEESARRERAVTEATRLRQETASKITGEERAQETAARAVRLEQQKHEAAQRAQLESDRRYELSVKKEERAAAHQRQQDIIKAFQHLGASIAAGAKGSAISPGGVSAPEQDTSAFRIAPAPQRRPPQPVDARQFQRQQK